MESRAIVFILEEQAPTRSVTSVSLLGPRFPTGKRGGAAATVLKRASPSNPSRAERTTARVHGRNK
jgi:hypothetical protein